MTEESILEAFERFSNTGTATSEVAINRHGMTDFQICSAVSNYNYMPQPYYANTYMTTTFVCKLMLTPDHPHVFDRHVTAIQEDDHNVYEDLERDVIAHSCIPWLCPAPRIYCITGMISTIDSNWHAIFQSVRQGRKAWTWLLFTTKSFTPLVTPQLPSTKRVLWAIQELSFAWVHGFALVRSARLIYRLSVRTAIVRRAVKTIQSHYLRAYYCPEYEICRKRLAREFNDFNEFCRSKTD